MKRTTSKAKLKLFIFLSIIFLNGCGSGGSESDEDFDSELSDITPPSVTLSASAYKGIPNQSVELTYSATDGVDGDVNGTLSCDLGDLNGSILTLPEFTTRGHVNCTYFARDSAGNSSSQSISIEVINITITPFDLTADTVTGATYILDLISSVEIEEATISATLGGEDITLVVLSNGTVTFTVPFGVSGNALLEFTLFDIPFSQYINVVQTAPPADPVATIQNNVSQLINEVTTDIAASNDPFLINYVLPQLEEGLDGVNDLDETELINLAIQLEYLLSNGPEVAAAKVNKSLVYKSFQKLDRATSCQAASAGLIVNGTGIITSSVGLVGSILLIPETGPIGLILAGVTGYITKKFKPIVKTNFEDVFTYCGIVTSINILKNDYSNLSLFDEFITEKVTDELANKRNIVKNKHSSQTVNFVDEESRFSSVELGSGHRDPQQGTSIDNIFEKLNSIISRLEALLEDNAPSLRDILPDSLNYDVDVSLSNFYLLSISQGNISGSLEVVRDNNLRITFQFDNKESIPLGNKENFSFTLKNDVEEAQFDVDANLVIKGFPTANSNQYTVIAGEGVYGELSGENTEEFEIVTYPENGTLTFIDSTKGQFGYDAPDNYRGTETFTFIAINAYGQSAPVSVDIQVISDCIFEVNGQNLFNPNDRDTIECDLPDGENLYNWFYVEGTLGDSGDVISVWDINTNNQWIRGEDTASIKETKTAGFHLRAYEDASCGPHCVKRIKFDTGYQKRESGSCVDCYRLYFEYNWQSDGQYYWSKKVKFSSNNNPSEQFSKTIYMNSDKEDIEEFEFLEDKARDIIIQRGLMTEGDLILLEDNWGYIKPWLVPDDIWPLTTSYQ